MTRAILIASILGCASRFDDPSPVQPVQPVHVHAAVIDAPRETEAPLGHSTVAEAREPLSFDAGVDTALPDYTPDAKENCVQVGRGAITCAAGKLCTHGGEVGVTCAPGAEAAATCGDIQCTGSCHCITYGVRNVCECGGC
jgi:hypothetical protein